MQFGAGRLGWVVCSMLVSTLSLLAGPAIATIVTNNAFGTISAGGTSVFFQHDFTEPIATVSGSASGTDSFGRQFSGTANAYVNSSDFGDLRFSGSATFTGSGQAAGDASLDLVDTNWLFSNAALTGQSGVANVSVLISGDWSGSASALSSDSVFYTFEYWERNASGTTRSQQLFSQLLDFGTGRPGTCHAAGSSTLVPCTGLVTFSIPFVFGAAFGFEGSFVADAIAVGTASASFDFAHSLQWGGISSVTVGGSPVSYSFQSDSGFDWTQSSIPTNAVPEPASIALVMIGLAVLVRRRLIS